MTLVNGFNPAPDDRFDLFDANTVNSGGFNVGTDLQLPALGDGLSWDTSNFTANGQLDVIPEPTTPVLAVSAVIGACLIRRRQVNLPA